MIYKIIPRFLVSWLGKNSFTKRTSLSYSWAREKFVYKTNLAFSFLGSGKIRLQNEPRFLIPGFLGSGKNDLQNQPRFPISRLGKK